RPSPPPPFPYTTLFRSDGFLESVRRSPAGLKNQGWKDSDEAIRYPDGRLVENPLSTVEEQAFHWLALQRMAEILVALGEDGRARSEEHTSELQSRPDLV